MNERITTSSPRDGATKETDITASSSADVQNACRRSREAQSSLVNLGRAGRASMLHAMASALEEHRNTLVDIADSETALGAVRLNGELTRTVFQFRLFAEALLEGSYLEAAIDHAGATAMGPRPDLRRMLVPIGPVAVFGASNFPFAFSVPGGDTASALAAGCPVVFKAHEAHPLTSRACFTAMQNGLLSSAAPADALQLDE
jgi:NADP-dependent aldehyde dehydrogenase